MIVDALKIIIFILSLIGIKTFEEKYLKVSSKVSLAFTIIATSLIIFLFSLINLLTVGRILVYAIGLLLFLVYFIKRKYKDLFSLSNIVFGVIILIVFLFALKDHLVHYDNYSHWAVIVKYLLDNHALPTSSSVISFPNYPPGTAIFISFFCFFTNSSENFMIIGQNIITISLIISIFNLIDSPNKILKWIMCFIFFLFNITILTGFNSLLVDSTVAFSSVLLFMIISKEKEKSFFYLPFLISYLYLVKTASLLFIIIAILYYFKLTKNKKHLLLLGELTILLVLGWNLSAYSRFKDDLYLARHQMSISSFVDMFKSKGIKNVLSIIKNYLLMFINFKEFWINMYFWFFNILLIPLVSLSSKKERKSILTKTISYNVLYIIYFIFLGFMYIFSMPMSSVNEFACYDRYLSIIIVINMSFVIKQILSNKNYKYFIIPLTVFMIIPFVTYSSRIKAIWGEDEYDNSITKVFDEAIANIDIPLDKTVSIYSPISINDNEFLYYLARYKLNRKDAIILYDFEDNFTDYIIALDYQYRIYGILNENNYQRINPYLYIKSS